MSDEPVPNVIHEFMRVMRADMQEMKARLSAIEKGQVSLSREILGFRSDFNDVRESLYAQWHARDQADFRADRMQAQFDALEALIKKQSNAS